MAKYLLLKHYRGAPTAVNDVPMDQWTPEEVMAHVQYMQRLRQAARGHRRVRRRAGALPARARSSATTARGGRRSPTAPSRRPRT